MKKCTISLSANRITVIERYNSRGDLRLKKCQRCGTISQDADVVCGICGTNIANTPSLEGSIEEEILKDQKLREEESRRIRQKIPRESTRELMRRLLPSLLALAIGFTLLLYRLSQALAMGGNSDLQPIPYRVYAQNIFPKTETKRTSQLHQITMRLQAPNPY